MFSPSKVWLPAFREVMDKHTFARTIPRFTGNQGGAYPLNPLKYIQLPQGPLAGSQVMVTEQRMSGLNAIIWNDPSLIL